MSHSRPCPFSRGSSQPCSTSSCPMEGWKESKSCCCCSWGREGCCCYCEGLSLHFFVLFKFLRKNSYRTTSPFKNCFDRSIRCLRLVLLACCSTFNTLTYHQYIQEMKQYNECSLHYYLEIHHCLETRLVLLAKAKLGLYSSTSK